MKTKFVLLLLPFLVGCNQSPPPDPGRVIPEHNYDEVLDRQILWHDVLSQEPKDYCVYFYSKICQYCDSIRNEVIDIALSSVHHIYFCNDSAIQSDRDLIPESTIGIDDIENFKIKGIPTVIEVENHAVKSHNAGKTNTLNFLRKLD